MHLTLAFGLVAVSAVMAVPAPAPTPAPEFAPLEERGFGGVSGSVPEASGTVGGSYGSGVPFGCVGGGVAGFGETICARATPAPEAPFEEKRQEGGQASGSASDVSGIVFGTVPANGIPFGCVGGIENGVGITLCAREPVATPAPELEDRQVGGGIGGAAGSYSGSEGGTAGPSSASYFFGGGNGVTSTEGFGIFPFAARATD